MTFSSDELGVRLISFPIYMLLANEQDYNSLNLV